jgi:hypothetical protein
VHKAQEPHLVALVPWKLVEKERKKMPSQIAFLLAQYIAYARSPGWRWPDGDAEDGLAIWSMTPANNRR